MSENWFIGRGDQQFGPFTIFELKNLGTAGKVQPTDTVWNDEMANRVPATRVKGLLPPTLAAAESPASIASAEEVATASEAPTKTPEQEAEERRKAALRKLDLQVRPRRVTGIRGAILLSQDGKDARVLMKCLKCGTEDRSRKTLKILPGASRAKFFCPNCRRISIVEMTGV
jgi:hypothetical protein